MIGRPLLFERERLKLKGWEIELANTPRECERACLKSDCTVLYFLRRLIFS